MSLFNEIVPLIIANIVRGKFMPKILNACHMEEKCIDALRLLISQYGIKTVLEFGGGYSTKFFSELVDKVYTVEHNPKWVFSVDNGVVLITNDPDEYSNGFRNIEMDLILIDGKYRAECFASVLTRSWKILAIHDYNRDAHFYQDLSYEMIRHGSLAVYIRN